MNLSPSWPTFDLVTLMVFLTFMYVLQKIKRNITKFKLVTLNVPVYVCVLCCHYIKTFENEYYCCNTMCDLFARLSLFLECH